MKVLKANVDRAMLSSDRCALSRGVLDETERLSLAPGQIEIWVAFVDEAVGGDLFRFEWVLTAHEREQRSKFHFVKDRRRYFVTRLLVRYALSRYVAVAPEDWRFAATDFGRPFIVNPLPAAKSLVFNLSHSDRVVVLGVTRQCRVGIDVEDRRANVPLEIADSCFSADERRQLQAVPPISRADRFLDFWTLKESYIKARGKGLSLPLERFGFDLSDERRLQAHFAPCLADSAASWRFWQWQPSADSIAALCVENTVDVMKRISVRRTVPFLSEVSLPFEAVRESTP